MASLKIALRTFDISRVYQNSKEFKNHLFSLITQSLDEGAEVVVLPAYTAYGLSKLPEFKTKEAIAKFIWTEVFPEVMTMSEKYDALICAGSAPNIHRDTKNIRNRAIIAASGKSFESYQRCLAPWENAFESGTAPLFYEWKGHKFANLIGFDVEFPELSTELKRYGPHFVLCPVATADALTSERVMVSARARASELGAVVLVSSLVGTDESNPLVDSNEGRLGVFYPLQLAYEGIQSSFSPLYTTGDEVMKIQVDTDLILKVKRNDGETKSFLKTLNSF